MKLRSMAAISAATMLAFGGSLTAVAQQDIESAYEVVNDQLEAAYALIESEGLDQEIASQIFEMDGGETTSFEIELEGGLTHAVLAVCDADCSDVDVAIYDYEGDLLDSDIELDDSALITGEAPYSGAYEIQISMASCTAEPCIAGYSVYTE